MTYLLLYIFDNLFILISCLIFFESQKREINLIKFIYFMNLTLVCILILSISAFEVRINFEKATNTEI